MLELEVEAEWSQEGPTLSNDIWKKFQLIPTPPRSPSHDTDLGHTELSSLGLIEDLSPLDLTSLLQDHDFGVDLDTLDNLDNLDHIDLLPDHLAGCGGPGGLPCAHGTCTSCTQLALAGSELRHDCMWRGTCTAEAHAYHSRDLHHHHHHTHRDSTSNLPELLMDTSSALECAAGFTHLHDLDEEDDEDDNLDDMDVDDDLSARPDTPSESSETDTDEEDQEDEDDDDEEEEKLEGRQSPPAVHVDHSYYCPRAPSPRPAYAPAMPHTPSESEDEIDVVSLGSPDSAYSSSSSTTTTTTTRVGGEKRKRGGGGGRTSGGDPTTLNPTTPTPAIPSTTTPALPTATATTTFVTTTGSKKVVKIRTSNLPSSPSKASRHRRSSGGSKRRLVTTTDTTTTTNSCSSITHPTTTTTTSSTVGSLRRTPTSPTTYSSSSSKHKRIRSHHHHHHHGRKRRGHRSDSDDPEKRHLHNSLERMRRVDLRNAFEELRALVPGLCDKDKAPKVEILRRASEHCYSMTQRGRLLEQEKEKQKRLQGELRKRLANLHKQQRLS